MEMVGRRAGASMSDEWWSGGDTAAVGGSVRTWRRGWNRAQPSFKARKTACAHCPLAAHHHGV